MREANCSCGRVRIACEGEPAIVSICHCLACQRRTGSAFGVQAWYSSERVHMAEPAAGRYVRQGDSGSTVRFSFCPDCATTVYWQADRMPGMIAVAVGAFADPVFPAPVRSIWERRRHAWTDAIRDGVPDHAE